MMPRRSTKASRRSAARRGLMLVVVLIVVALLSLLAASYTFMVRSNLRTVEANHNLYQARMAAESGVQHAIVILRDQRADIDSWYDHPEVFFRGIVEGLRGEGGEFQTRVDEDSTYDPHADPVWRYHLVAPNNDDPSTVRYGATDECARLDINQATEGQVRRLLEAAVPVESYRDVDINVLVDSLMDWKDQDTTSRPNGAETDYYQTLEVPYACKSQPFATVEELLLVRGFDAWVLFGEDYNRNGLLDLNEDDGDESFPPDNGDGLLYAGIAPFLTVWSREVNASADNRPRINLNDQDTQKLQEKLEEDLDAAIVSYVMNIRSSGKAFNSIMNLLPAPPIPDDLQETLDNLQTPAPAQSEGEEATSQPADGNHGLTDNLSSDQDQTTPAISVDLSVYQDLTDETPPGAYEDLPLLWDRLTVDPTPGYVGRIDVSTAPREVLRTLEALTIEEADAIAAARVDLTSDEKNTPAWLLTRGVIDEAKFRMILPNITTRSAVFRINAIGFGDHVGVAYRLEVVLAMQGPVAQVIYYRNLNELGPSYNPHGIERRDAMGQTRSR